MQCLPALDYLVAFPQNSHLIELKNQRIGLLTNHTGCTKDGVTALNALRQLGLHITTLFSPEHGFAGNQEGKVLSSATSEGVPIYSLYGETRQPTAEMLSNIDVFLCDLQDVGARFYTYSSTLALAMEACAAQNVRVVVLDRPNPLGGINVAGPARDVAHRSFVGHLDIPIIHGMTMGELALLHRADQNLDIDLQVVPIHHWQRNLLWSDLNLPWRIPSPNLPNFTSAAWYPGLCLLEFSAVSVGRGTDAPFQILGAPWMNPAKVLSAMKNWPQSLKSTFSAQPIEFIPTLGKWENTKCHGVRFDADILPDPQMVVHLGMALLATLHQIHTEFETEKSLSLLGSARVLELLTNNQLDTAFSAAEDDARRFNRKRRAFLMYDT